MDGQEFADLRDHEILDTVERLGSHLENMGSKLPDHGAKLRARIQRLKEEFSRRQELHSPAPLRTAVTAHSSTGRSPELAPAPSPASPSTSPHPVPVNSSTGSNTVPTPAPSPASPSTFPHLVPPENKLRIFSGTANLDLSREIANYLGLELGKIKIESFANGDMSVQLPKNVEGCDVYLVQSICTPINENLAELLGMMNACCRSSVKNITAVIPYLGDARWDCTIHGRESPGASLVAKRITEAGASRVIACDLHSKMSKGYFDIPVDHVCGSPVLVGYLAKKGIRLDDLVVVSPAVKGASRARFFAWELNAPLAIVDEEVMNLDVPVNGKIAVMVVDMIDTAGTICKGAALLHQEGAREVYACCTHAVFSSGARERLLSGSFKEVIVTDTIPVSDENHFPHLRVQSFAKLLGETIQGVHDKWMGAARETDPR